MTKVHVVKHQRTIFRKLAFGEAFWLASNVATAPFIKIDRRSYSGGWAANGAQTQTNVADTRVAVVRVPGQFLAQNRTLS